MSCPNKKYKYYRKKEKAHWIMGLNLAGGGYCSKDIVKSNFGRKESRCSMAERYKNIIDNLRKGIVDRGKLGALEIGCDQMTERIHFYENLIKERDEHINNLNSGIKANNCKTSEMQAHIDCLKAELAEVQMNKQELPAEPIKVAEMLIYATDTYSNLFGKEQDYKVYDKSELKQIAEHLLVYCNNTEAGQ